MRRSIPHLAAACAALALAVPAGAFAQAAVDPSGGVSPGQPMLVAGPALVGQQQRITGTLGSAAGDRQVEVQAQAPGAGWSTIATTRAAADGSFATTWRAATTGRWPIRAVADGEAIASGAAIMPTATATVYRGATATWYSMPGNRTACGVRLRRSTIGVAHRTLPCGTRVDVTWGGRRITVPVIDRGPFVAGVHYDLTLAAASALGFVSAGRVRVGVLPAGRTLAPSPISAIPPALAGGGVPNR